jgi:hypothetical protein
MTPMRALPLLLVAAVLAGCAALNSVTSEVISYSEWPADRKPGRYAFERLPSQKANAQRTAELEGVAARALEKAGFTAAADPAQADVIVQIGARVTRTEISPWDDPLWWRWGAGYWRAPAWRPSRGPYYPYPYWSLRADVWSTRYERSVAVLIRDRATNTPLFESHAQNEGGTSGGAAMLGAMFEAALTDFPAIGAKNPRSVSVSTAP